MKTCAIGEVALQLLGSSVGSTFDDKYDLISALRGQIVEYVRETFGRRTLGFLESACYKKNEKKCFLPTETPDHCRPFGRPVLWSVGARFCR